MTKACVGSSYLYGLEYHDSSWPYRLFDMSDVEGGTLHDYDVPCAVCVARSRYTQVKKWKNYENMIALTAL